MTTTNEELEAALEEEMAPLPEDLLALREEKLAIDRQLEELDSRKKDIQQIFLTELRNRGVKRFILFGKSKVSLSEYDRDNISAKDIKLNHPRIFKKFNKPSHVVRVDIK